MEERGETQHFQRKNAKIKVKNKHFFSKHYLLTIINDELRAGSSRFRKLIPI